MRPTDYQRKEFLDLGNVKDGVFFWQYTTRPIYYRTPIGQRRKSYDNGKSWIENK